MPRHEDELELEVDDPLLVELQAEDYWYEAYNMRTGARGIFPAYYAIEVTKEPEHTAGSVPSPALAPRGPHVSPAPITPGLTGAPDLSPRDASPGGPPAPDPAQPRLPGGLPLGFLSVLTGAGNDPLHLQSVCPLDPASKGQL